MEISYKYKGSTMIIVQRHHNIPITISHSFKTYTYRYIYIYMLPNFKIEHTYIVS